jgi:hypothetical protein
MRLTKISKGLLLGLAMLLATSAFAANKGSVQFTDPVTVNGKELAAGDYNLKWEGNGPNVEVNILRGRNVVATVPARMVEMDRAVERNSVVTVDDSGRKSLSEIRFSGRKYALAIAGESAKAESNGGGK